MSREADGRELYKQLVNPRMGDAIRAMGFDRTFVRGEGAYLYDATGARYLDLIAGYGAQFVGRNHPAIATALRDAIASELPNLVQMEPCALAGLLAKALLDVAPRSVEMAYFASSGAEAVETAIKFSRRHTGKRRIVYLENAFHGMTTGALALNGTAMFREGFGPLVPGTTAVPANDAPALAAELEAGDVAAVIVEPIQGQGIVPLEPAYARALQSLCHRHGALVVADEVMTGLGRTGRWFACEHLGLLPDMLLVSKTLSGGMVPVSAVLMRRAIYDSVFTSTDRAGIHFSTFSQNKLAMAAGLATMELIARDKLVDRAARFGALFAERIEALRGKHDTLGPLRGKGLMLGVTLVPPQSLLRKLDWIAAHKASGSLFALKLAMDLFADHKILSLPSGRDLPVLQVLPPAVITEDDIDAFVVALDRVLEQSARFPGVFLGAVSQLAMHALPTSMQARGDER
jgi:acetylornithine/succinyldiaminopimelate/putrescine aminotransferase